MSLEPEDPTKWICPISRFVRRSSDCSIADALVRPFAAPTRAPRRSRACRPDGCDPERGNVADLASFAAGRGRSTPIAAVLEAGVVTAKLANPAALPGVSSMDSENRRRHQLAKEPLCRLCLEAGRVTPATVADHVVPHKGDYRAFKLGELRSLCAECHDARQPAFKHRGYSLTETTSPCRSLRLLAQGKPQDLPQWITVRLRFVSK